MVSNYFQLSNGVTQGGVLSPTLFNLYIDRLICKLRWSGFGRYINHVYMCVLSYGLNCMYYVMNFLVIIL